VSSSNARPARRSKLTASDEDIRVGAPEPVTDQVDPAPSEQPQEPSIEFKQKDPKSEKTDMERSSVSARTHARTNGQNDGTDEEARTAALIGMLKDSSVSHGHPQLERVSTSQRWPMWVVETVSYKARIEKRKAADIIADIFKRGLQGDPAAKQFYAESCDRVNARENDWEIID
jgi:hypothetical protein